MIFHSEGSTRGCVGSLEHDFVSPFWRCPEVKEVLELRGVHRVGCRGARWSLPENCSASLLTTLEGVRPSGKSKEEEVPVMTPLDSDRFCRSLCESVAREVTCRVDLGQLVDMKPDLQTRLSLNAVVDLEEAKVRKMRAPPVAACWDDLTRWRLALKGLWKFPEH